MANTTQLNDFGEKIGGARKDLWQRRGLLSSDLLEMNEREADKYVRKDNIWKKIDYQTMMDSGIPFDVVYFIKTVKDSLPASPRYLYSDNTPESRLERQRQYIDTVREIQGVMEGIGSKTDALGVHRYLMDNGYIEESGAIGYRYRVTAQSQDNPTITSKLMNAMLITSEARFEREITREAQREQFGVPKEQKIPKGYEVRYNDGKNTWSKNDDWQPDTYYVTKGRGILQTNLATREDAVKWAQEAAGAQSSNRKQRYTPPQLEHIRRDGIDYRHGHDADGQDYLDAYGFKGGEFGNWMTQNDRRASLNMGFDALKDLADALKISDRDISYGGALSIAFGSRGQGTAVAHYEPMRQVINLTKMRGAGSLAHEWWHGLDDYLGRRMGVKGYMSDHPHKHPLFQKLMETIQYKAESPEQAAKRTEVRDKMTRQNAEQSLDYSVLSYIKNKGSKSDLALYDTLKASFLRGDAGSVNKLNMLKKELCGRIIPKEDRNRLLSYERILRDLDRSDTPKIERTITDYYADARAMGKNCEKDGGYWDSNVELTARAFATYVMDRLPSRSDYLVGHAECASITIDANGEAKVLRAYPVGQEREAINAVFDELVAELKRTQYLTHDDRLPSPEPKIQPAPRPAPPVVQATLGANGYGQISFGDMLSQQSPVSSIRFLREGQDFHKENWSLYEYSDRVELHRPDGIEKLLPEAGQTANDIFLKQMSGLLSEGLCIEADTIDFVGVPSHSQEDEMER